MARTATNVTAAGVSATGVARQAGLLDDHVLHAEQETVAAPAPAAADAEGPWSAPVGACAVPGAPTQPVGGGHRAAPATPDQLPAP